MDKIQSFPCRKMQQGEKSSLYQDLISSTQNWLVGEGFEYQEHALEDGGTLLQIKKSAGWKKFVGMDTALNILFHHVDDTVNVEIGAGRWADKAAVGAVSMVVFAPLLVTAGIGAYQQAKMPERIFEHIATFLSQHGEIINEFTDTQQETSSINNSDSVNNSAELIETISSDPSRALYVELVPELLALCISADGLVEESEIEIAMALIENEELIENKQTALESLSLNIDKFSTEIKKSKAIFKLKAASLIAKAANLDNDLYRERLIIIIEGIQETVSEEGVAETTAIIDAIKNKLK